MPNSRAAATLVVSAAKWRAVSRPPRARNQSRAERDPAKRKKLFEQIAAQITKERPVIYMYHRNWLWAYNPKLSGVREIPDGLLRISGLKLAP